jgi:predicted transcriptional regulator
MIEKIPELSTKVESGNFKCADLVKCVFNLSITDMSILRLFSEKDGRTIKDITREIKKDRSTVHRSLEKLISCKLCYKERKGGENRGFVDYYYKIPNQEIYKKAEFYLDQCYIKIKGLIKENSEKNL